MKRRLLAVFTATMLLLATAAPASPAIATNKRPVMPRKVVLTGAKATKKDSLDSLAIKKPQAPPTAEKLQARLTPVPPGSADLAKKPLFEDLRTLTSVSSRGIATSKSIPNLGELVAGAQAKATDDQIPGLPITASPVAGSVDYTADRFDVFSVPVTQGSVLEFTLSTTGGGDALAYLYSPDASALDQTDYVVSICGEEGNPSELAYLVPPDKTGTYYIAVIGTSGTANYSLQWAKNPLPTPTPASKAALLVGVADYPGDQSDLNFCDDDAISLAQLLVSKGGYNPNNVLVLTDSLATKEAIKWGINNWLDGAESSGSQVVFMDSSHGTQIADVAPYDEIDSKDEAICPWDSVLQGTVDLILDDELDQWLASLESTNVEVVVDSCFSGGLVKSLRGAQERYLPSPDGSTGITVDGFAKDVNKTGREVMTASDDIETSIEWPPYGHGAYTYYLLDALKSPSADTNANKYVSGQEAYSYLYPKVVAFTQSVGSVHHPQFNDGVAAQIDLANIEGIVVGDDDVPGATLPASPFNDTVDSSTDTDDVYQVPLTAGQSITVNMTGAGGTNFNLYFYKPGTPTVASPGGDAYIVAYSQGSASTEQITYTAAQTGTHYLDIWAGSGSGQYQITYQIGGGGGSDDDVPGVALPASPVNDSLDKASDTDDVYKVPLAAGQWFFSAMIGETGTDFDLFLYKPGAPTVASPAGDSYAVAGSAYPAGYVDAFIYKAPTAGTYYLDVYASSGAGAYQMIYGFPTKAPSLSLSSPSTIAYGGSAKLACTFKDGGVPRQDDYVNLESKALGSSTWKYVTYAKTDANGVCTFTVKPNLKTSYRVTYDGWMDMIPGGSAAKTVTPKAYMGTPVAPTRASKTRNFNVYGYLKPRHTSGSYPVRVYKYRLVSGKWKSYGYVTARAYNYSSYTKYLRSIRLPYSGKWRLRAYHCDPGHCASWSSGYDYVTVR